MSAAVVATLAAASVLVGVTPAAAADGDVLVDKAASVTTVQPGQTFSYTIAVNCTTILAGCTNATLTDTVPGEFEVLGATVGTGLQGDVTITGQTVDVVFTMPIVGGTTGLPAATAGVVTIQVRARADLPYEADGVPVTNTATTDADTQQSGPLSDSVDVTPTVPLELATTVDKTIDPPSAVADPGTPVTSTITATNDANANVDEMVITDPVDPTASPNPFETLPFTGIGSVTYPAGADTAQILLWDGTAWVPGPVATNPAGPAPPDVPDDLVRGVQVVFTDTDGSGISQDAEGGIVIGMEHGPDVQASPDNVTVTNSAGSEVTLGDVSATDDDSATHQIVAEDVEVTAGKSFSPTDVPAGGSSTATLSVGNDSEFPLTEIIVAEPTQTGDDPFAGGFDDSLVFTGFSAPIQYPAGATGATVTYYYDDGTSGTEPFADGTTPPAPSGTVVRFEIAFTGEIAPTAQTSIPFGVTTDPDQAGYPALIPNQITVTGTGPIGGQSSATADAELAVFERHIETVTGKSIYPNELLDRPGEWALVTLTAEVAAFPRSTTDATQVVIQEPQTVPYDVDGTFWDEFDATEITQTSVPADASLSINYWDGDAWVPLPGAQDIAGPTTAPEFSMDIPEDLQDDIVGLQFVYTADDGATFPPGTEFEPHFSVAKRATERDTTTQTSAPEVIQNCGSSSASSPDVNSTETADAVACDTIPLLPPDVGPGGLEFIEKSITEPVVTSRSQQQAGIVLDWSTQGFSNVDQVRIQDEAVEPSSATLAQSFYDAFDIVELPEITAAMDPHLIYDQVAAVQLWDGSDWVELANDPCPAACDGTFPGVVLTDEDRAAAWGIRLLFEESPTRAATIVGEPTAPPVGSGVARSSGNDRQVQIVVELRDVRRSDGAPAMGNLDYNVDDADPEIGTVRDVASAAGVVDGSVIAETQDDAQIAIVDVPMNVTLDKAWSNSPFGVPPDGSPQEQFPTGRVTLTATNVTAAKVDQLAIEDPAVGAPENPFSYFNLARFVAITVPAGADPAQSVVTLQLDSDGDGIANGSTDYSIDEALALDESAMVNIVGVLVAHEGRIDSEATAVVTMDLRLREFVRDASGARVDQDDSPVSNVAEVTVQDAGSPDDPATDDAAAEVEITDLELTVVADKSFAPATQTEPDDAPVTMMLSGQPTGSARTYAMRIEDSAPTFWNAFDYTGIDPSFTLTAPINLVRMWVYSGGTFTDTGAGVEVTGGTWTAGPWLQQTAFRSDPFPGLDPATVQGVRFDFLDDDDGDGEDGEQWENPTTPLQEVPVLVQRRPDLRSGGAVPSDRADLDPAPGESAAGEFSNSQTTTVCPFLGDVCSPDDPSSASDTAGDQIRYEHAISAVEITKSPTEGNAYGPDEVIPYSISVTNTGDWPIENPVIVDDPTEDGQLVVDPFDDEGDGTYRYALVGAAPEPANGLPLPTEPGDVTVDESGGAFTFTFPAGSVLEPGQTYTISLDLRFSIGLPGNTVVGNTAVVSGDRPLDDCNGAEGPVDECSAATEVTVVAAGAVRSGKGVRAIDDELGSFDVLSGNEDCAPNTPDIADTVDLGFAWASCVPRSKPGGLVEWRMVIVNIGNIPMDRLVLVDRLPTPGDTGAISDLPRGSQWSPVFGGGIELVSHSEGATWGYELSLGEVCADDLDDTTGSGGVDCPPDAWLDRAEVDESQFASVTGVRFTVDFAPGSELAPGDALLVDGQTYTPATAPNMDQPDPIAWNTVATGAHLIDPQSSGSFDMSPVEGTKTGVALATGSLDVLKTVSGPGQEFAPDEFAVELACTSAAGTPVEEELDPIELTLTADEVETVGNLPWGADCVLVEGDNGQVSTSGTGGVVVSEEPFDQAALDNVYELADLEISKSVDSQAVDAAGEPIDFGPYEVSVDCTFVGETVLADGFVASPMVVEIDDGETVSLTGLPANAECTISETDDGGADAVVIEAENGDGPIEPNPDGSVTVTLTAGVGAAITNSAAVANTFEVGSIAITKVVDPVDTPFADPPYVVHMTCAAGDVTTWDGELTFAADVDDPASPDDDTDLVAQIDDIAAGSSCTFDETTTGSATDVAIDPNPVTVGSGEVTAVTVTNTFAEGSVDVVKTFIGDDLQWAADAYEVTITCLDLSSGSLIVDIPGGPTRTVTAGSDWTASYERLPAGALCVLSETVTGGANSSQILDENGDPVTFWTVEGDVSRQFTVENTYTVGSLVVQKALEGEPAAGLAPATEDSYTVSLACSYMVDGESVEVSPIPGGATRIITGAGQATYAGLPTGAECTVTETDAGFATDSTISTPQPVVIGDDEADDPVIVDVVNTFANGAVSIAKTVDAPDGFPVPEEFTATLACTWQGADVPLADGGVVTIVADAVPVVVPDVPVGSVCTVEEDDAGQLDAAVSPESVTVTAEGETFALTIENVYDWASLEVGKLVESDSPFIPTQFEFSVVCTFNGETVVDETFTLDADETELINDIPARSECTVTETDARDADDTVVEADAPGTTGELAPQVDQETRTVVIPELQPDSTAVVNTVTYTNLFDTSALVLQKELAGAGADQFGADEAFTFAYSCTFGGEVVLEGEVVLSAANGWTTSVTEVVAGSECTVVEADLEGADAVVIAPNDGSDATTGFIVVPAEGGVVTITATNWYLTGSLEVTKTFAGGAAEMYGTGEFDLRLICLRDGEVVDIPGGTVRTVSGATPTASWTSLPTGAQCSLTETDDGGAGSTEILDENGEVVASDGEPYRFTVDTDETILSVDDQPQPALEVQNTFNFAQVSAMKTVAPTTAVDIDGDPVEYGPFVVELACTWEGEPVVAAEPMTQVIGDGETVTWTELPEGAECSIAETNTMDATATTVTITQGGSTGDTANGTVAALDPLPSVDAPDQTSVALVNEYADPPIVVSKVVDGADAADFSGRSFTFDVRCVLIDASHPAPGLLLRDGTYEIGGPIGPLVTLLPTGAECTITEIDTGGADETTITVDGVPLTGTTVTTVMGTATVEVVVTNTFDPPLAPTGFDARTAWIAAMVAILLIGAGVALAGRRRREGVRS